MVTAAISPQASGHHLHLPVKVSSLVTGGGREGRREGRQQFNVLGFFVRLKLFVQFLIDLYTTVIKHKTGYKYSGNVSKVSAVAVKVKQV